MTSDWLGAEVIEFQCPHCGNQVRQNIRRFEAGVKDPLCLCCRLPIKFNNEQRNKIIEGHKRWLSGEPRRYRTG